MSDKKTLKLFDYEAVKDQFLINRINNELGTNYEVDDLYSETLLKILRKLTALSMTSKKSDTLTELLGDVIFFIENNDKNNAH